ncbi:MAG: hypothetical protein FWD35_01045 [Oscillospiraceae bacterium]|nr:hypothetical protein [Oscillospiraceae bacterium]
MKTRISTKRLISLFIALTMIVSMIPMVTLSVAAYEIPYEVKIAVRSTDPDQFWLSDAISVTGTGTYKGTVHVNGETDSLVAVAISTTMPDGGSPFNDKEVEWLMCVRCKGLPTSRSCPKCDYAEGLGDPRVHPDWDEYVTRIEKITVNNSVVLQSGFLDRFKRQDEPVAYIGLVHMELWNGWWLPHNKISPVDTFIGVWGEEVCFRLESGAAIETFEIEFTVFDPSEVPQKAAATPEQGVNLYLAAEAGDGTSMGPFSTGTATNVTGNGTFSAEISFPAGTKNVSRLAILSEGGDFCPVIPLHGKATPAPEAWRSNAHLIIESIEIGGTSIGSPATTRWNTRVDDTSADLNSHFIAQPSTDGSFNAMANYVDIPLWNGLYEPSRILREGVIMQAPFKMGDSDVVGFSLLTLADITSLKVNFRIEGIAGTTEPDPVCTGNAATCKVPNCTACATTPPPVCTGNKDTCTVTGCTACDPGNPQSTPAFWRSSGLVTAASRARWAADNTAKADINDALQILRSIIGLQNEIADSPLAQAASNIKSTSGMPDISDGLQVLRSIIGLDNDIKVPGA